MSFRTYWRRLWMAVSTVGGLAPRGYFIPYRYAASTGRGAVDGYTALLPFFEAAETTFAANIERIDGFADPLVGFDGPPPEPRWSQDWFPGLDGAAMYTFVRSRAPGRMIEIGSGHSTRFAARAIRDGGFECAMTAIDPAPRADIGALGIECIRAPLQQVPLGRFADLSAGDILSIDSSHVAVSGSDVDILVNQVMPGLPSGVLVQIHDIFLPDLYPAAWAWREYNEQSLVAPLVHGGGYELLWSSRYVRTRMADCLTGLACGHIETPRGAPESSLWLIKR
ncbi:MAG: class I SAM-dependent methyltransferase [Rhodospirillales bacterium]